MTQTLISPLFTDWSEQYVRLCLPGVEPGEAKQVALDGEVVPFQYTGQKSDNGAEVLVRLGFDRDQHRVLQVTDAASASADLSICDLLLTGATAIGAPGRELTVGSSTPFLGFADFPMTSAIACDTAFEKSSLSRVNDGPLFTDYVLEYHYAEQRRYTLRLRCYKLDPCVEVSEAFSLRMNGGLKWTLNPERKLTHIVSRDSFEGDDQPTVEPLSLTRPGDVLCRLQMPVLSEYFIPNNRGWFGLINPENESVGMLGIMGLYGSQWKEPVANMPEVLGGDGTVQWQASLASGSRHWLLYAGPVETSFTSQRRFVFHRLHGEFNVCRLDDHLDLTGDTAYDCPEQRTSFFPDGDYHEQARARRDAYPALQQVRNDPDSNSDNVDHVTVANYRYLLDPNPDNANKLYRLLIERFELWVRQFQGYRRGTHDYAKNVIGFTRYLRGMLLGYEMLRRDNVLTDERVGRLNAYFIFAARRITDEGRWPHSRTALHPDHPDSVRDLYTYGGEHRADRLYWTNSLPNFQSDPLCALAHLSAVFRGHPDSEQWLRLALTDIDNQLDAYCGKSGAWEESINYALYTMSYFVITFRALKVHLGVDYFQDERVRRFASWLVRFLGPRDKRWDRYTWPGVGNALCPTGGGEYLLCFAGQLDEGDPLRDDLISVWQRLAPNCNPGEHYPTVMAALAPLPEQAKPIRPLVSELMDEVGVAMRDRHNEADESYLFQKIGFFKDHYEAEETAFNWYAKGTPLCMDYGTYTSDIAVAGAHNLVEIPDADNLRRGYLKAHHFTPIVDYTHCECPITLKLLWGRVRPFAEVDGKDGVVDREKTPYHYIGDKNPVGPKVWKVRLLMFVKPDYVAIFDRVIGEVPHRYNLHVAGNDLRVDGNKFFARGDFDMDLLGLVQHPHADGFDVETGRLVPNFHPLGKPDAAQKHAQSFWRLYNTTDGIYRTLLFAQERDCEVSLTPVGHHTMCVKTTHYTDHVFIHDQPFEERFGDIHFRGCSGWVRQTTDGRIRAMMIDGDLLSVGRVRISGRGPWSYNFDGDTRVVLLGGPPRKIQIEQA